MTRLGEITSEANPLSPAPPPSWFRGVIQGKTRIALAWIFVAILGFTAREYPTWPGITLCLIGATLRFWASGYLRKDSRPAVGGPYAYVRNPLYLGTYLMALGVALSVESWALLAATTVLFAVIYHYIILDEETKLRRIFGEPYSVYCTAVPRFFPRLLPAFLPAHRKALDAVNPDLEHRQYSWSISMKNKSYEAYASFAGLVGLVAALAFAWKLLG